MCDTFYLFETFVPFVYKFGYTTRNIEQRMRDYVGVGKPKQMIGHFNVATGRGRLMEQFFKEFLRHKNIHICINFGAEYISYFDTATDLFNEFYDIFNKELLLKPFEVNALNKNVLKKSCISATGSFSIRPRKTLPKGLPIASVSSFPTAFL